MTREPPLPSPHVFEDRVGSPIVLSIPHSGRDVPDWLAGRAAGGRDALLALADPHVDRLAAPLIEAGHAAVVAAAPRAAIDPNRRPDELDPMIADCTPPAPGSKAYHGIGLIPSRGRGRRPLWKERLGTQILESRLASGWTPYHDALAALLDAAKVRHGHAILLDLHSMPPPRAGLPRIVLGDRHGASASPLLVESARTAIAAFEPCGINHPYAGGAICEMQGRPGERVEAIQVEFDRSLYLDPLLARPGPGLTRTRLILSALVAALSGDAAAFAAE